jgi:hypothetical protein
VRPRSELGRQVGQVVGLLEHIQQVKRPAALHLGLQCIEVRGRLQRLEGGHANLGLTPARDYPHPARRPSPEAGVHTVKRVTQTRLQVADERGRVKRLTDRRVVQLPGLLKTRRKVVFGGSRQRLAPST